MCCELYKDRNNKYPKIKKNRYYFLINMIYRNSTGVDSYHNTLDFVHFLDNSVHFLYYLYLCPIIVSCHSMSFHLIFFFFCFFPLICSF